MSGSAFELRRPNHVGGPKRRYPIDWIERIFHVNPDGGNGSVEMLIGAGILVALLVIVGWRLHVSRLLRRRWRALRRSGSDARSFR